jgi:hypothetical protein
VSSRRPSQVPAPQRPCAPLPAPPGTLTKTGTTPATAREPAAKLEGSRRGEPEVDVALGETTDIETGPAAEDLAHGELGETTVDADGAAAPSSPRTEDLIWNEESQAITTYGIDAEAISPHLMPPPRDQREDVMRRRARLSARSATTGQTLAQETERGELVAGAITRIRVGAKNCDQRWAGQSGRITSPHWRGPVLPRTAPDRHGPDLSGVPDDPHHSAPAETPSAARDRWR